MTTSKTYDTKIAVVVRSDLAQWQKLNIACFISGGLAGAWPEIVGAVYRDADGRSYGPLVRQPIVVLTGDAHQLARSLARANERGVTVSLYTSALFATSNDEDNRAAVAAVGTADLDLVGLGIHAQRKDVDKIVKGLALHP